MLSLSPVDRGNFWSKSNINLETNVRGGGDVSGETAMEGYSYL